MFMLERKTRDRLFWTDRRWLLVSALTGLTYGLLTVFALISGLEHRVALTALLGVGAFAGSVRRSRPILIGFVAGFLTTQFALATQILLMDIYFANNPDYLEIEIPLRLTAVQYTLLLAPFGGLVAGLISAFAAILVRAGFHLFKP